MEYISLTQKQKLAANHIAFGGSKKEAAELAKVTPQTISEWMQLPAFKAHINSTQYGILTEARDKFRVLVSAAISNLERIMNESDNDKLRLDAAKYILERANIAPANGTGLWAIGPTDPKQLKLEEDYIKSQEKTCLADYYVM